MVQRIRKLGFGSLLGLGGKVAYDRFFAKRPNLRYAINAPARFGSGEKARIYQNIEISNKGNETTSDVRINFNAQTFPLVEHQVVYDGAYSLEKSDNHATVLVPNLPPGDKVTVSFVFPQMRFLM
ncbi:MAG TPA: hypothetical protein VGL70_09605 [Candidatus Binatia bacterium]|jgi:hypothetical protein